MRRWTGCRRRKINGRAAEAVAEGGGKVEGEVDEAVGGGVVEGAVEAGAEAEEDIDTTISLIS